MLTELVQFLSFPFEMVSTSTQFFFCNWCIWTKRKGHRDTFNTWVIIEIAFRKWNRVGIFLLLSKQKTFLSKIPTKFKRHTQQTLSESLSLFSLIWIFTQPLIYFIFISRRIFCWNGVNRSTKRQNLRTCFLRSARPFQRPLFVTSVFLNHPPVKTVS